MGCGASKEANPSVLTDSPQRKAAKTPHAPAPPPVTRTRIDSWAAVPQTSSTSSSPRENGKSDSRRTSPVERQWKVLWESQSPLLIDPADVPTVLDDLLNRLCNKFTAAETNMIQRKLRAILLSQKPQQQKMRMLRNNDSLSSEQALATSFRLIHPMVLSKLMPSAVADNFTILLIHFSESLWNRVQEVAVESAKLGRLDMDVNHYDIKNKPPKPSVVPEIQNLPELPPGFTLRALVALLALGLRGTRVQRLQLLFYLCHDDLSGFLSHHPAGGVPCWLLEVGQETLVSLASLTHYHYFGTAFLPKGEQKNADFLPSKSRKAVSVPTSTLRNLIRQAWNRDVPPEDDVESDEMNGDDDSNRRGSIASGRHKTIRRKSSTVAEEASSASEVESALQVSSPLLGRVWQDSTAATIPEPSLDGLDTDGHIDLAAFISWAEVLSDKAVAHLMHFSLGATLLPSPNLEAEIVRDSWRQWRAEQKTETSSTMSEVLQRTRTASWIWGGIGGPDGSGGSGLGLVHCIDKKWWDKWVAYTGWRFDDDNESLPIVGSRSLFSERPRALLMDSLLESNTERSSTPGTLGSYQVMRRGLQLDKDYVLIPPSVWDILYEMYGGGPPLPRMISGNVGFSGGEREVSPLNSLQIETHPLVVHVQLCDPSQPYRRGDIGPASIRCMSLSKQPLWRLIAEILSRFSLSKGRARLWKRNDPKEPVSRYGPWHLLTDGYALVPHTPLSDQDVPRIVESWEAYGAKTLESLGIRDQSWLLLEFAATNKNQELYWPREAAAKAGRVRQLAEEDRKFRNFLMGVDDDGNLLLKPPKIVGAEVDAMDSTGRWYPVRILQMEIVDEETEHDEDGAMIREGRSMKKVRVDFAEFGGHTEWIDVESDKLAAQGRFTSESSERNTTKTNGGTTPEKNNALVVKKSAGADTSESTKVCLYPGYGACGLANLGNTCYVNSAIQCMSYLPLLRSYLLSSQYKITGDLNKDNPLGTGGKLLEEFAELLRAMWSARVGEKTPTRFRQQLGKINGQFAGADQQDAQEFLNYMLDVLHEDSNKVRQKPYVEALEDEFVMRNKLTRVGEEAWRRFLRRNRSIMADVTMGQVLNTVTCPKCKFSSRNFDPFNLLSIPIPTVADVLFRCKVYRRASPMNTPQVLNRVRKGDKRSVRFPRKRSQSVTGPPSETFIAEEYMVDMFRMADSGDLRLKLQNLCGINAKNLRLCRVEERALDEDGGDRLLNRHTKIIPLTDKEGPCSQLAKARQSEAQGPTDIIAFESTLVVRPLPRKQGEEALDDTADEDEEGDPIEDDILPKPHEQDTVKTYVEAYGDSKECRLYDSDPLVLSKAISRSIWPTSESELKVGLRVDAKDHRGQWFPGTIVEITNEEINGGDTDTGQEVELSKRNFRIHFDYFPNKWDEKYTFEKFEQRHIRPVFSRSTPRRKLSEFVIHHRYFDRVDEARHLFGQSFFVECYSEWSNARAGAHILAQVSRFMGFAFVEGIEGRHLSPELEGKVKKSLEKAQNAVSDLIDLLIDCDREYVQRALGLSEQSGESSRAFRNTRFDVSPVSSILATKAAVLLQKIPFEIRVCTGNEFVTKGGKSTAVEESFPFSLVRSIGNFVTNKTVFFVQWRDVPWEKKSQNGMSCLFYLPPRIEKDNTSQELATKAEEAEKKFKPGNAGMDLGVCLTEFCKTQNLTLNDNWRCPRCKKFREGRQHMDLWRLPDLLTFHIKRFNMSARWREKITTKVNFPLTGLNLSEWCHEDSPVTQSSEPAVYDLIGVVNHLGGMTGGHYVANCKATAVSKDGREEDAYNFPGAGVMEHSTTNSDTSSAGWRFGGRKPEPAKMAAAETSKAVSESAEPLWLHFDDELVEPIPPRLVVSEMAYVLFYRKRQMSPSNIAKYSTLE